jgi:hypothetical protein
LGQDSRIGKKVITGSIQCSIHSPESSTSHSLPGSKHGIERRNIKRGEKLTMRHPAAPTIIAVLLGVLGLFLFWGKIRGDGYHEGNPHPAEVPKKGEVLKGCLDCGDAEEEEAEIVEDEVVIP